MSTSKGNKSDDPPPYSGFVLTFEPGRTKWLQEQVYPGATFSESFSALDSQFQRRELVILVLAKAPFSISAIAMMERMPGSGGFRKIKMRISDIIVVDPPVEKAELTRIGISAVTHTPETLKRTSAVVWKKILLQLKRLRPDIAEDINLLIAKREEKRVLVGESSKISRLIEQRDALGIGLEIAKLDRTAIMRSIKLENAGSANSILDLLDTLPVQERSLVEHECAVMNELIRNNYRSALFEDGSGREVRIYVADKTPLETVLGIDLLIYQEC